MKTHRNLLFFIFFSWEKTNKQLLSATVVFFIHYGADIPLPALCGSLSVWGVSENYMVLQCSLTAKTLRKKCFIFVSLC